MMLASEAVGQLTLAEGGIQEPSKEDPHLVKTRYGNVWIDTREPVWRPDGKHAINVGAVRDVMGEELSLGFEATLRSFVRTHARHTIDRFLFALLHYRRTVFPDASLSRWSVEDLRNYRSRLIEEFGHEGQLIKLRSFLKHWYALRMPGVGKDVYGELEEMRLKGAEAGRVVRTMDPKRGPLTEQEQADLDADVFAAAEDGAIGLDAFAQYLLQNARTGSARRSDQLASLKCGDVNPSRRAKAESLEGSSSHYHLIRVPRSKQHGADWRQTFRDITMSPPVFAIVHAQRLSVEFRFDEVLGNAGLALPSDVLDDIKPQLPLFPAWFAIEETLQQVLSLRQTNPRDGWAFLRQSAQGREWHSTSHALTDRLQALVKGLGTPSRTGEPLPISSLRMRHTKGTNLARAGTSLQTIAWLMDHSTTGSVFVYVDNLPEHAAAINEALKGSWRLQTIARMFRGTLVDCEAAAKGGDNPRASRIHWLGEGAATCGTNKRCGMDGGIPLACYTCNNFQPWLDGPHEEVLIYLRKERENEANTLGDASPIVKRRDETILAVIDVIQRCDVRRRERAVA
jgi:hypothetical protein